MRAAVLTISDGVHAGVREDASGELLESVLREEGFDVVRRVVPDERSAIVDGHRRPGRGGVARTDNRRHRLRTA